MEGGLLHDNRSSPCYWDSRITLGIPEDIVTQTEAERGEVRPVLRPGCHIGYPSEGASNPKHRHGAVHFGVARYPQDALRR